MVEDALSEEILLGHIRLGDRVRVVADGEQLTFLPVVEAAEQELVCAGQPNMD